jgi:hypothetical protein
MKNKQKEWHMPPTFINISLENKFSDMIKEEMVKVRSHHSLKGTDRP